MFFVVCSAVAALACRDIERPLDQRGSKPVREQEGPPVVLALTCELNGESKTVTCSSPPAPPSGVSASVIYGSVPGYAQFYPVSLVKDTIAHTWQFTAYVQNLLKQSIGTLNGTTVTGVKVFITDFHATAGTGTVSVANADGTSNFTAPNQPYFNYNQIVAPTGYTSNKLWKFNVPNTVTAVSVSILISTDFPAAQGVALLPPDSTPAWVQADSNVGGLSEPTALAVPYAKRVLQVYFKATATLADRQLAVAYVNGTVVGGWSAPDGSNAYYILQVPDDGTGSGVMASRSALKKLPQVESALIMGYVTGSYLKPRDGLGYQDWSLNPDSVHLNNNNWTLEAVDAPFAWGCSTGSSNTVIGVDDYGFHADTDMLGNIDRHASVYSIAGDTTTHGTAVESVIAARGNNAIGITGAMWQAALVARNAEQLDSLHPRIAPRPDMYFVGYNVAALASLGARVVNISQGHVYPDPKNKGHYRVPGSSPGDDSSADDQFYRLMRGIRAGQAVFHVPTLPLLVVSAGNFEQDNGNATTDSWWASTPRLADSLHDTVVVVGSSNKLRNVSWFSGVNATGAHAHNYVDIMAPGDDVVVINWFPSGDQLVRTHGTTFAAGLVTGAAGLLVSFDFTLGAPIPSHGAPELKHLILAGADSNTMPDGTVRKAGNYRFLSLYKPLVLAARRPGAPLCGNRVWSVNGQVVAMRNSTVQDTLFSTGESGGYMTVMHGGHRILFLGDSSFNNRQFVFDGTRWTEAGNPDTLPPAIPGGSAYSELQASHNGDSAVVVQAFQNGTAEQINVSLEAVATRVPKLLSSWTIPLTNSSSHFCIRQNEHTHTDTLPPYTTTFVGYSCVDSSGVAGSYQTANAQAAYSPLGDRVIVTVNRRTTTSTAIQTWQTCPGSTPDPDTGAQDSQCRASSYQETDDQALVYAVRTADGVRSQLTNIAAGDVFWRAVSEPGAELVLGVGSVTSTWDIVPHLFVNPVTGGGSLTFVESNNTWQVANCRLEYRTLATGTVNLAIPTNDPCTAEGMEGSGTFSPRRVANSGVY
jgi:hypothetical protein